MSGVAEKLAETRQQLELEVCEAELEMIRHQKAMSHASEFGKLREANTTYGDPTGHLHDEPRWHEDPRLYGGHHSRLEDRLSGKNDPFFHDETELAGIRGDGRLLAGLNEVGVGVVRVLKNFTVGTGYTYSYSAREASDETLAEAVQDWNDEFDQRVQWDEAEREILERAITDGESFLEMESVGGGRAEIRFVEPDAVTEPNGARTIDEYVGAAYAMDWSFGIATDLGRPTKRYGYFIDLTGDQRDWGYVPDERMIHVKRNVVRNVKRGLSDFFSPAQELRRADKILRNTGEGAALQSAIAWIREHPPGTTASQVVSMSSAKTEIEVDRTTPFGSNRTTRFQRYMPGTILDVRAGQSYKAGPMGSGQQYIDVSSAILRYAAIRWNMPDWLISSDSSTSNFASVLVTESPFTKSIEVEQKSMLGIYLQSKWKMLDLAVRSGRFSTYGIRHVEELKQRVQMNVLMPRVTTRNKLEDTKIGATLHQMGLLSKQTWSAKEELNYKHEKANLEVDPPEVQDGDVLRKSGLDVGLGDKEFQPQANEPGNVGQMPEMGDK